MKCFMDIVDGEVVPAESGRVGRPGDDETGGLRPGLVPPRHQDKSRCG
jgi:hypothetical protein